MTIPRRACLKLLLAATAGGDLALVGSPARAQRSGLVEGQNYVQLRTPQTPPAPGRIDVIEFFSYACPHCNEFEPLLEPWVRGLSKDVAFRRVPVPFLFSATNFQKTYYALESLGLVDAMQAKVFAAVHRQHMLFDKPAEIVAWVGRNGVDATRFKAAFDSFSVATEVRRAGQMTSDYGIAGGIGVPALAIQGRYITSPAMAGGNEQALAVANALIQIARSQRPA